MVTEIVFIVAVLLLVLVNGFFVAAEFTIVRSRAPRLQQLADEGHGGAARARRQIEHVDEYVATAQVGITLASLGIGFLGEPAVASLIEPALEGPLGATASIVISFGLAYLLVTLLHVIVGEQAPKMVGIATSERLLIRLAGPLEFFKHAFRPLIAITNRPARFIVERILRLDPDPSEETSPEELRLIISQGAEGGALDPEEAGMLGGVFHLHEQTAREVMTPVPAIVTVDADGTVEDGLRACIDSGHTRLLAVEGDNPDRVRGTVHSNSLAELLLEQGPDAPLAPAVREAPVVPETKPLDGLLAELRRDRSSLGVISDEYGRTIGIATVEDILEEVVGEIEDETDPPASNVSRIAEGDFRVSGHVPLGDLEDEGITLPVASDAFNSVGGYLSAELGRLPREGDEIDAGGYELEVEEVRDNRVVSLRIRGGGDGDGVDRAVADS